MTLLGFLEPGAQAPDGTYTRDGAPYTVWFELTPADNTARRADLNADPIPVDTTFGSFSLAVPINETFVQQFGVGRMNVVLAVCPTRVLGPGACVREQATRATGTSFVLLHNKERNDITLDLPARVPSLDMQLNVTGTVTAPDDMPVADQLVVVAWRTNSAGARASSGAPRGLQCAPCRACVVSR